MPDETNFSLIEMRTENILNLLMLMGRITTQRLQLNINNMI